MCGAGARWPAGGSILDQAVARADAHSSCRSDASRGLVSFVDFGSGGSRDALSWNDRLDVCQVSGVTQNDLAGFLPGPQAPSQYPHTSPTQSLLFNKLLPSACLPVVSM